MIRLRSLYLCALSFIVLHSCAGALIAQDSVARRAAAFSAGMGVSYVKASDVVDYISSFNNRVEDFKAGVEFFAAPEISLNSELGLKLEYAYLLTSYNISGSSIGNYSFDYSIHMPTALLLYVFEGEHYFVKLGGGIGYHFGKFTELRRTSGTESRYTSNGIGFKVELMGNTAFGESLYGVIGGDLRLDFVGRLKDRAGESLKFRRPYEPSGSTTDANLHFVSVGIKFGLMYYF